MKTKNNKKILIITIIIIALILISGTVYAWFSGYFIGQATREIEINNDWKITTTSSIDNGNLNIKLKNEGSSKCFARVKVTVPDYVELSTTSRRLVF